MAGTTLKIKQSSVIGKVPAAASLTQGELAINTNDEKLYSKNSSGDVFEIGGAGGAGGAADIQLYEYTATAGQTDFPASYNTLTDYVNVYYNGVKLHTDDYTNTSGTNIVLAVGATAGDVVLVEVTRALALANGSEVDEHTFTATAGQTSFAIPGGYSSSDDITVYSNGIKLLDTTDFTRPDNTNVVLTSGAALNDEIVVRHIKLIALADVVNKTGDTGSAILPAGTTAQRDGTPLAGYLRWNSTEGSAEVYDGTSWGNVSGAQVLTDVPAGAVFTDTVYTHPTGDGNLHVPATGTTNNGKILTAGGTAGSISWQDAPVSLPDQATHAGKYLTTDGTDASWASLTATNLALVGNNLTYTNTSGVDQVIDLSPYLDDTTNTIQSGVLSGDIITFTREDGTTFAVDASGLSDNYYVDAITYDENTSTLTVSRSGGLADLTATITAGAEHFNQSTTPVSADLGDTWYDVDDGIIYKYINDGVQDLWVDISTAGAGADTDWADILNKPALYTQTEVDTNISTAITNLVDSAPATLDTLNELSAALNDDANFATTVTNELANKSDNTHNHDGTYEPADSTILKDADIGVNVQAYSLVLSGTTASFTTSDETKLDGIEASANNYTHPASHLISEVTNLQTELDAKATIDDATAMAIALG